MKNKYIVFASIGFELVAFILLAIYSGEYLVKQGFPNYLKALLIVAAFLIWFISLFMKLKSFEKSKQDASTGLGEASSNTEISKNE